MSRAVSSIFGPYIPLLIPWTDRFVFREVWVRHSSAKHARKLPSSAHARVVPQTEGGKYRYPPKMYEALRRVLRPSVPYITVNQNDEGMTGKCELLMSEIPNVLVLSAGGYGHVPIPLFIRPVDENRATPVAKRPYLVS